MTTQTNDHTFKITVELVAPDEAYNGLNLHFEIKPEQAQAAGKSIEGMIKTLTELAATIKQAETELTENGIEPITSRLITSSILSKVVEQHQ